MPQQKPNPSESSQAQAQSRSQPRSQPRSQLSVTQADSSDASIKPSLIRTLRNLSQSLNRAADKLESEPRDSRLTQFLALVGKLWQGFLPLWRKLLSFVRSRLPEEWNRKLSDRILSSLVAGTLIIAFWFTSSLLSPKPASTTIATRPTVEVAPQPEKKPDQRSTFEVPPQPNEPFPTDLSAPEALPEPEVLTPEPSPTLEEPEVISEVPDVVETTVPEADEGTEETEESISEPLNSEETAPEPESAEIISEPEPVAIAPEPVISEPVIPEPVIPEPVIPEPVIPEPPPVPEVELTPEQKRIAAVQDRVFEISDRFISGLVDSVSPNFDRRRLTVTVTPDWYRFNSEQQDRFANELWQQLGSPSAEAVPSRDFTKLEITDQNHALLARNPVVGSTMVILKRK